MRGNPIPKQILERLYIRERKSCHEIAFSLGCSDTKVDYWLMKHNIRKRTISDAVYAKRNPYGDPFLFSEPKTLEGMFLFGLGLGLYWGEGTKRNKTAIRLGNTDPRLIKKFILFLTRIYRVERKKFKFGLQIFSDMKPSEALTFWSKSLGFSPENFHKVIVTPTRSLGTYKEKTKHGVLTVYVSNKKLRDLICSQIEMLK